MSTLPELTLCEVVDALHIGEVKAVEVAEAICAAVHERGPALNAFIWNDFESALNRAQELDRSWKPSRAFQPLYGVPMAHKDMFYQQGRLSTAGSKIRKEFRPNYTATVITRLEAAGSITVGGLNMAEFAQNATGHNLHHGNCKNPWNTARITGGSSSGSGAAVSARLTYGSLGSDTGGSIRVPASLCGVTGLKLTWSRASLYGVMPMSHSCDTVGPLARTARDCARILSVIAGHDSCDPDSARIPVHDYEGVLDGDLRGVRIGIPDNYYGGPIEPAIQGVFDDAIAVLKERGATVCRISVPYIDDISTYCAILSRVEAAAFHAKWMRERLHDFAPHLQGRLVSGAAVPAAVYLEALSRRGSILRAFCKAVFSHVDVIAVPTVRIGAPLIAESDPDTGDPATAQLANDIVEGTRPVSYLGVPAVTVPSGFDGNAMPVGTQLIGRPFGESLLLKIADAFQRDTSWHKRTPPMIH